jgi:hypothetical protein
MRAAEARYIEAYREKVLRAQVASWQETQTLSRYLKALETVHGESPGAVEWLDWIRHFVAQFDPLNRPPTMPQPPEIKPEELKPYLGGLSPYGPRDR